MLTDPELVFMRDTLNSTLPETVQVQRATRVADGAGGTTETWVTVATVAGRFAPEFSPPQEPLLGDRPGAVVRWVITLPAGTNLKATDRLLINGRTFEVRGVDLNRTWAVDERAHCSEVL